MSVEDSGPSAMRGWGFTPTGDPPAAVSGTNSCLPTMFTRGWRRTTLYGILVFLMLLVFLNIALTLWIVGALKLSMNGIGPIRIVRGGIQLDGQAWVVDNLLVSTITSQVAQPITLHSHRNFTVMVADPDRVEYSKLFIKRDSIEFSGRSLHVRDARGASVFQAARDEVRVFADALAVDGPGGLSVRSAVQVSHVHAPPSSNLTSLLLYQEILDDVRPESTHAGLIKPFEFLLRHMGFFRMFSFTVNRWLESLTRRLDLRAPQSIYLESRAGSIDITSHGNIKLDSIVGAIRIDAPNIIINNLKEAVTTEKPQKNARSSKVYQLCACASGKLFLAAPEAPCAAHDDDTELCR